jgi:copper chaperone CopZ
MLIRKRFQVDGMECVGCTIAVEGALEDVAGVNLAEANYARQFADVEYDSELVSEQQIASAVERAGYNLIIPGNLL